LHLPPRGFWGLGRFGDLVELIFGACEGVAANRLQKLGTLSRHRCRAGLPPNATRKTISHSAQTFKRSKTQPAFFCSVAAAGLFSGGAAPSKRLAATVREINLHCSTSIFQPFSSIRQKTN